MNYSKLHVFVKRTTSTVSSPSLSRTGRHVLDVATAHAKGRILVLDNIGTNIEIFNFYFQSHNNSQLQH